MDSTRRAPRNTGARRFDFRVFGLGHPRHIFFRAVVVILLLGVSGCAGVDAVRKEIAGGAAPGAYIDGVPVVEQTERTCGPAALATVVAYYETDGSGAPPDPGLVGSITERVYTEKLGGTLAMDILIHARELGYGAEYYQGGLADLKERVASGEPPILFLNVGLRSVPVGHYVVAVGFSDASGMAVLHTGGAEPVAWTYERLERQWALTGHTTILVTPGPAGPAEPADQTGPRGPARPE